MRLLMMRRRRYVLTPLRLMIAADVTFAIDNGRLASELFYHAIFSMPRYFRCRGRLLCLLRYRCYRFARC